MACNDSSNFAFQDIDKKILRELYPWSCSHFFSTSLCAHLETIDISMKQLQIVCSGVKDIKEIMARGWKISSGEPVEAHSSHAQRTAERLLQGEPFDCVCMVAFALDAGEDDNDSDVCIYAWDGSELSVGENTQSLASLSLPTGLQLGPQTTEHAMANIARSVRTAARFSSCSSPADREALSHTLAEEAGSESVPQQSDADDLKGKLLLKMSCANAEVANRVRACSLQPGMWIRVRNLRLQGRNMSASSTSPAVPLLIETHLQADASVLTLQLHFR